MRVALVIFLFLSICGSVASSPCFFVSAHSFGGSYYHPDRDDKVFSYYDKQDIRFGILDLRKKQVNFEFTLKHDEELLENRVGIHTLRILYQKGDKLTSGLLLEDIGYGMPTEYFNNDITTPEYRKHRLGDYRFTGLLFSYDLSSTSSLTQHIGGNDHNTSIAATTFSRSFHPLYLKLFYLYTGRDNDFNKAMHSAGVEMRLMTNQIEVFLAHTQQTLSSVYRISNHLTYGELLFKINNDFHSGGNLFYAGKHRGFTFWREYSLLTSYRYRKLSKTISYTDKKAEDIKSGRLSGIIDYSLADNFALGINTAFHFPQVGKRYYSFGFQLKFHEKYSF
jgi:hypothetical protein